MKARIQKIFSLFLVVICFRPPEGRSQKLVQDSLRLNFEGERSQTIQFPIKIDTVFDFRNVPYSRLIGIDEVTRYVLVPVDLHLVTARPFADVVRDALPEATPDAKNHFSLGIHHFELSNRKEFLSKRYQIHALVRLYPPARAPSLTPLGELIFASSLTQFFKTGKLKTGYESVFRIWSQELTHDLVTVVQGMENEGASLPYNFRPYSPNAPWMQLNAGGDFILTRDGFLIDGRLHFTFPEARRLSFNSADIIRFRHQKKFDSIEYGLVNHALNYRLNPRYLFQFRSHLLLGLNRWKDMNRVKHKLYDALIGDFSISQSLQYHPQYARTLILGVGLYQSVYYLYSSDFKFQFGLLVYLGGKI
ncbi:MAG: hypothetical protein ONB05_01385 [candidate division KSB1 bacterium]|nr:hypothetical protein [candidate division KSB1 bacterium]